MSNSNSIIKRNSYVRYCDECEELYKPTGKFQKLCEICRIERTKQASENMKKTMRKKYSTKLNRRKKE